jgi:hypothetical protein
MIADSAEAESDAELLRKRRRSLADVCFEWMGRGDLVTIAVAGSQFEGRLVAAVNDLLILQTATVEVVVNASTVGYARSDRRGEFEGTSGERGASSFRAQLGRHEVDGTVVRIVGDTFDVTAVIVASSDDHVLLCDNQGVEWALPRHLISYAIV